MASMDGSRSTNRKWPKTSARVAGAYMVNPWCSTIQEEDVRDLTKLLWLLLLGSDRYEAVDPQSVMLWSTYSATVLAL